MIDIIYLTVRGFSGGNVGATLPACSRQGMVRVGRSDALERWSTLVVPTLGHRTKRSINAENGLRATTGTWLPSSDRKSVV